MMLSHYWNQKFAGLLAAMHLIIDSSWKRTRSWFATKTFRYGLKETGKNIRIGYNLFVRNPSKISIGNDVSIGNNVLLSNIEIPQGTLSIDNGASIDNGTFLDFSGSVFLREKAHIAQGCYITTHSHGYDHHNAPQGSSLEIGKNAFVGAKSIVLYNCNRIGDYAVVGAGSVVTRNVPDYAIVAGNPARIIKINKDGK